MRMYPQICVLAVLMVGQSACAQDSVPADEVPPPAESTLQFDFTPGVWLPRLNGDTRLGPSPAAGSLQIDSVFDLADSETVPRPELCIRKDDFWQLRLSGFDFSTDAAGDFPEDGVFGSLNFRTGDPYRASVDITSVAVEFGADLPPVFGLISKAETDGEAELWLTPFVGLRYFDIDQTVELIGTGTEDVGRDWLAIYGGLELRLYWGPEDGLPIGHAFKLEVGGGIGPAIGGSGGWAWELRAGATLELTPNLGIMFGYRLFEVRVEDDQYEFDAGLQGLFIAATIRF